MADALWLGTATGMEANIVLRHGVRFRPLDGGPLVGVSPARLAANALRIGRGTVTAWWLMRRERPDAVLVTGGYASVPVALAARLRSVPLVVFLPDVVPGRAVRLMASLATRIAAASPRSLDRLPRGRAEATGYPVRQDVRKAERQASREMLALGSSGLVLLAFGGSRGARRINQAVVGAAPALLQHAEIVHVTGSLDHRLVAQARDALPPNLSRRYHVFEFLASDRMAAALAAADLVVSRAGAAVMGEYPARSLPSILVPLPIAGGHQSANAAVLADAGAATVIEDADLDAPLLERTVSDLLSDPPRLAGMAHAAHALDRPDAAVGIWRIVVAACVSGARETTAPS